MPKHSPWGRDSFWFPSGHDFAEACQQDRYNDWLGSYMLLGNIQLHSRWLLRTMIPWKTLGFLPCWCLGQVRRLPKPRVIVQFTHTTRFRQARRPRFQPRSKAGSWCRYLNESASSFIQLHAHVDDRGIRYTPVSKGEMRFIQDIPRMYEAWQHEHIVPRESSRLFKRAVWSLNFYHTSLQGFFVMQYVCLYSVTKIWHMHQSVFWNLGSSKVWALPSWCLLAREQILISTSWKPLESIIIHSGKDAGAVLTKPDTGLKGRLLFLHRKRWSRITLM